MKRVGDLMDAMWTTPDDMLASTVYGIPLRPIVELRQVIMRNGYKMEDAPRLFEAFIKEYAVKAMLSDPPIGKGYVDG